MVARAPAVKGRALLHFFFFISFIRQGYHEARNVPGGTERYRHTGYAHGSRNGHIVFQENKSIIVQEGVAKRKRTNGVPLEHFLLNTFHQEE